MKSSTRTPVPTGRNSRTAARSDGRRSKRTGILAAVNQNILPRDVARLNAAQIRAELPELHRVTEPSCRVFRNSLLPVITLFGNVFPLMISGSIVIEVIFSLPGMGKMLFDAIVFKDFPVVFTLVMMTAFLTMIGYLIVDILYALVDPRISYK